MRPRPLHFCAVSGKTWVTQLVTVSGVAASGIGRHQMAGGALQAVLVRVAWFPLLHKLHMIAKTHGALLLDKKANETAVFHMSTQCVDCVGESMVFETMVFELLGEREPDVEESPSSPANRGPAGDEWMYILQKAAVNNVAISFVFSSRSKAPWVFAIM